MSLLNWFHHLFEGKPKPAQIHADLLYLLDGHMPFLQQLHASNSLAPLAASMDMSGEVTGQALTVEDGHENPPVEDALDYFVQQFQEGLRDGSIRAAAIFFHGCCAGATVRPAQNAEEANALIAWLEHSSGQKVQAVIAYRWERHLSEPGTGQWTYDAPKLYAMT